MLVLRLQRTGRRNVPAFRLVVCEKTAPIKGKVQEYLGYYLPTRNPHVFECDQERVQYWLSVGAVPSDTVARLLKTIGLEDLDKFIKSYTKKRAKNAPPEEEAPPPAAEAPAQDETEGGEEEKQAEEAPAEEPTSEEATT